MPLILVVEDDPTQRLGAIFALKKAGFDVIEAVNGEAGLALIRTLRPDLVVCDVVMPEMNGYQMLTSLRNDVDIADIPVILLTAMADHTHMRIGMTSGADDYLAKPFKARELVDAVAGILAKKAKTTEGMKTQFSVAMDEQKQTLAQLYEQRLLEELNDRWAGSANGDGETSYEAAMLLVDAYSCKLAEHRPGPALGREVRNSFHQARDALYLFGAELIMPFGTSMLALFVGKSGEDPLAPRRQAIKAALAVVKPPGGGGISANSGVGQSAATQRGVQAVGHFGAVSVVSVSDPLLGGKPIQLVVGVALSSLLSLQTHARAHRWRVGA